MLLKSKNLKQNTMSSKLHFLIAWIFVLMSSHQTDSANILVVTPIGSQSHKNFFMGLAEPLAKRGHTITIVSHLNPLKNVENIREVTITNFDITPVIASSFSDPNSVMKNLAFEGPRLCSETLAQKQVQDLKKEKFDLVILSYFVSDCYLSLVHHFKAPFIYGLSSTLYSIFYGLADNIDFPSFVPNHMLEANFPLNFVDRLKATLYNAIISSIKNYSYLPRMESLCREMKLCPDDMPPLSEIRANESLAIINLIRPLEFPPRPRFPNFIYAGGVHLKPPKRLPKDLEDWISSSGEDGVIIFSLGSITSPKIFPERYRKLLVKVFGSLKQKVLWKWNEPTMQNLPKNVKLIKWFPQQDVLGHPKVRLFITHGGMLSTLEALHNAVPIIGMPIFADQFGNIKEAKRAGWANRMNWEDLNENNMREMILHTITNKSMYDAAKSQSALMKDVPISPAEEATFWIEYVLRHKGAQHLKSPITIMSWYKLYNIDVWGLIVGVVLMFIYLSCRFVWVLLRCFKSKQTKSKQE